MMLTCGSQTVAYCTLEYRAGVHRCIVFFILSHTVCDAGERVQGYIVTAGSLSTAAGCSL